MIMIIAKIMSASCDSQLIFYVIFTISPECLFYNIFRFFSFLSHYHNVHWSQIYVTKNEQHNVTSMQFAVHLEMSNMVAVHLPVVHVVLEQVIAVPPDSLVQLMGHVKGHPQLRNPWIHMMLTL
ncbi:Protein CBG17896 [Caenorhabditis briggsae]|uniref:Protein CBG17896 n=1 Tax=Caenorhabditis briggsae TaxID=6238 RepID=A8XS19_CAEBR|nr:Protein CBG17896 [Caenorhabditis briggsae]CAP35438.2 Protein CBG17896 [Caenorhabditis briggsae]